jgi:hypothetical protein
MGCHPSLTRCDGKWCQAGMAFCIRHELREIAFHAGEFCRCSWMDGCLNDEVYSQPMARYAAAHASPIAGLINWIKLEWIRPDKDRLLQIRVHQNDTELGESGEEGEGARAGILWHMVESNVFLLQTKRRHAGVEARSASHQAELQPKRHTESQARNKGHSHTHAHTHAHMHTHTHTHTQTHRHTQSASTYPIPQP